MEKPTGVNETRVNETVDTTTQVNETQVNDSRIAPVHNSLMPRRIIYYILGTLEILFAFRLILKVLGANPDSPFVDIIYSITNLFLAPFEGIFRMAVTNGIETESVLEPSLIIAMIVYAALAWGLVQLIEILKNRNGSDTL